MRAKRPSRQTSLLNLIYFVQRTSDKAVKIGTTIDLALRLQTLANDYGNLHILGVHSGGYEKERDLHTEFASLKIRGEWFRSELVLIEYVHKHTVLPKMETLIKPKVAKKYKSNVFDLLLQKQVRDSEIYRNGRISRETGIRLPLLYQVLDDKGHIEKISLDMAIALADWLECDVRDLYSPIDDTEN